LFIICIILFSGVSTAKSAATRSRVEQPVRHAIETRQSTQKEEEQWHLEKEKLVARFEQLQQKEKTLIKEKEKRQHQISSAKTRIIAKEKQLADIEAISSQIQPFIGEIFNDLKLRVTDGLPFLEKERQGRIQRLETLMADPDVEVSEKYRKVMEALLVEAEYGFTIEAYQETITIDGKPLLADIFRLGRISLFYQSLDRKRCGFYNGADADWQDLDPSFNLVIQPAIDIAAKRRPVELLTLPVGRMVVQ
jgi:hypothetical protein